MFWKYLTYVNTIWKQYVCYTKEYQYLKQLCDNYVNEILDYCKNMEQAREVMLLLKMIKRH